MSDEQGPYKVWLNVLAFLASLKVHWRHVAIQRVSVWFTRCFSPAILWSHLYSSASTQCCSLLSQVPAAGASPQHRSLGLIQRTAPSTEPQKPYKTCCKLYCWLFSDFQIILESSNYGPELFSFLSFFYLFVKLNRKFNLFKVNKVDGGLRQKRPPLTFHIWSSVL